MKKLIVVAFAVILASSVITAQRMPEHLNKLFNAVYGVTAFYVDSVDENRETGPS